MATDEWIKRVVREACAQVQGSNLGMRIYLIASRLHGRRAAQDAKQIISTKYESLEREVSRGHCYAGLGWRGMDIDISR